MPATELAAPFLGRDQPSAAAGTQMMHRDAVVIGPCVGEDASVAVLGVSLKARQGDAAMADAMVPEGLAQRSQHLRMMLNVRPVELETLGVATGGLPEPLGVPSDPQVHVFDPCPLQARRERRLREAGLVRPCRLADVDHYLHPVFEEEVNVLVKRALLVSDREEWHGSLQVSGG